MCVLSVRAHSLDGQSLLQASQVLSAEEKLPKRLHFLAPDKVNDAIRHAYQPEFAEQARHKLVDGTGDDGTGVFRSVDISLQLPEGILDHSQNRTVNEEGMKNIIRPDGDKFLVYAAGIAFDSDFEEKLAEEGYEVHAFDCTVNPMERAVTDKMFTFHKTCIGKPASLDTSRYAARGLAGGATFEFKLVSQIMAELGHTSVDLLKFDIEGFEWKLFYEDLMNEAVPPKQMAFELHTENAQPLVVPPEQVKGKDLKAVNTLFLNLYDLGYRVVSKEINPMDPACAEFVVVKVD